VLLAHLPRESSYVQAVVGDAALWSHTDHLIANVVDHLTWLNHNYVQAHSKKRLDKPKLMRRPGMPDPDVVGGKQYRGRARPLDELRALTEKWRRGKGGDNG